MRILARVLLCAAFSFYAGNVTAAGSPGPEADVCPAPDHMSAKEFPVRLPRVSLLGAPNNLPDPFKAGVHWGDLPPGRVWGATASVTHAPDNTIWVADRCGQALANTDTGPCGGANAKVNPIFQFDTSGKLLKSWGAGLFAYPHKLEIDQSGNVWIADSGSNQVFKLDQNGHVLMVLGKKGRAGLGHDEFDAPTDVAIGANGDIFVADGHTGGGEAVGNARIVKFDRNGKFLMTWGKKGMGPGEFDLPHALVIDSKGRLFVADRANDRIQIFDQNGKFLAQWFQFGRPSALYIDKNDMLYVGDGESRDGRTTLATNIPLPPVQGFNLGAARGIRIGSVRDGIPKYMIPDPCPYPYRTVSDLAEGVTIDNEGNLYAADPRGDVRKFEKRK